MKQISKAKIESLKQRIVETIESLELDSKKSELEKLEAKAMKASFWDDPNSAKTVMARIEEIKEEAETATQLTEQISTLKELFEASKESEHDQLIEEYNLIEKSIAKFETLKFLSGKYDKGDAMLSIHAGQGGTEANDWAEMLLRMYSRYCDKKEWKTTILHAVPGTETGYSSATLEINGKFAYGLLKKEAGTHRLVRLSPFNAQNLRQTSFAGVEVTPVIEDDHEIEIKDEDIEFKAVRSGGPGGQSVNKTSSAVQITHTPSGITVHSSEHRSQSQNRKSALKILKAKLWQREEEEKRSELKKIKGEHKIAGWGNQIRNYILHPYKLVKDLRTKLEVHEPEEVLDGELDKFIEAGVRMP